MPVQQTVAQNLPPLALAPGLDGIEVIFYFLLAFAVLALLTPVLLQLNHRVEEWRRRKKDREFNEHLIQLAVKEGRLAAKQEGIEDPKPPRPFESS